MEINYRAATNADIAALARLRSEGWGEAQYWMPRITGYLDGTRHPQKALAPRVAFVAMKDDEIIGFIAGHLTTRLDCDGELEWIDVTSKHRRKGIASELVRLLAKWFEEKGARKVCVDPGNEAARKFYASMGAENLDQHWMYWRDISHLSHSL
ncbi:GNAT family N-acetyltransferase [Mucilaginibacter ginsenosidivorans]|uniref:GNAT family N-acetyltransferase n=1 Tax=Mucilaginibacter ginsenosidivorans TaxID=398053 RepID=A0A5B8V0L1_9SPHI|nr:GNAT family N-acetyltransferase [Mucilaginibacter ginsenosidivorans]QEC64738.1 GNAT family N-acetyltransferase [Mucilaginibacter ginsenosidivorans]